MSSQKIDTDKLLSWGWDAKLQAELESLGDSTLIPCRVVGEERGFYRIVTGDGPEIWGEITGKFRHATASRIDFPATGDWVVCVRSGDPKRLTISKVLTRKSYLVRKAAGETDEEQVLATNVDVAFVMTSLNADLNVRRLERYLALIWDSGAKPVILLSKADLAVDAEQKIAEVQSVALGADVHSISVRTANGIEVVRPYLPTGSTAVLLGSSGVGKSTLVNHLLGKDLLKTQDIREDDAKGRHTTTSRYLVPIPSGAMLIDTPGMRELHLWGQEEGIDTLFDDISELSESCRFTNCGHNSEPDCAVKAALTSGKLAPARLESFRKLQGEARFETAKTDRIAAGKEKKKNQRKKK